jgi:hypothetical protein
MKKLITAKGGALLAAVAALSLLVASMASGELVQEDNLRISFHGSISPEKLPRNELAPVGVQMGAKIKTVDRTKPPRLAEITLDINSKGVLDATGLPTCPFGKLRNAKAAAARKACGEAEVGHGNVTTRVEFPGQGPFSAPGTLIAFNAKEKGKQAIFAYVDSTGEFSTTFVIKFIVKKTKGTYGTSLVADVPPIASGSGYISAFDLSLKRRYTLRGERRSYVSASCPLPAGVPTASFPLVRSTYGFEDAEHTEVVSVLTRECRVRG